MIKEDIELSLILSKRLIEMLKLCEYSINNKTVYDLIYETSYNLNCAIQNIKNNKNF